LGIVKEEMFGALRRGNDQYLLLEAG